MIPYNGESYYDDRMFVLSVFKCTVEIRDDVLMTTIYHEKVPENHIWCVVTFKNVTRYMGVRVDRFETEDEAISYMKKVEPGVPLINLGGRSPKIPFSYDKFVKWKENNNFKEYDYKKMFTPGGTDYSETFYEEIPLNKKGNRHDLNR